MSASTTLSDPPIDTSTLSEQERQELIISDTLSITSDTTVDVADTASTPFKSLHIHTKGIRVIFRSSNSPTQLVTVITNPDGSLAYTSTRANRSSGSCTLSDGRGKNVIGTEYFFDPKKDPVLKRLDVGNDKIYEIMTLSKWTSRNHKFLLPDGRMFEWRYKREKGAGANGSKGTALVLNVEGKRTAMLIRNDGTRTLGSKSCSAGNGGELLLGEDVGERVSIAEDLIVATCLLMLKREVDRRRSLVQFMMLTALII